MLLDQEADAHPGRVGLLAGFGQEDQIALERHAGPLDEQERHQVRGEVVLVVGRAPAPDIAVTQDRSERIHRPLVALHTDDVGVREEQQWPLGAGALQPRDQVGPIGIERQRLGGDTLGSQDLLEIFDGLDLVARRVARIDLDERPEVTQALGSYRQSNRSAAFAPAQTTPAFAPARTT